MMTRVFYRHDQAAVVAALRRGEPIDMATNLGHAPLDDLVALHEELGVLVAVERLPVNRKREGIPDSLLWRTAAVLRFLEAPSLRHATGQLCGEPAILLRLGWSLLQIEFGDNERHPTATGRSPKSLPCHPDTLRDELLRVPTEAGPELQRQAVRLLYQHRQVQGQIYAIDGTAFGSNLRLVTLVCVSAQLLVVVAWRLLEGDEWEKAKRRPSCGSSRSPRSPTRYPIGLAEGCLASNDAGSAHQSRAECGST